jgi:general secretion pathway protein J
MGLLGRRHGREDGFTLIEVMVSVTIMAFMSVLSYQAVDVVIEVNERSRSDLAEEAKLQRAWQIIGQDLLHLRPRTFVDERGSIESAYLTDPSEFGLRFSRGGGPMIRSNPSGVRRIAYSINEEQQLQRQSWAITGSTRDCEGTRLLILNDVEEILLEHLTPDYSYDPNWPPLNQKVTIRSLPKMIRLTIRLVDKTETTVLFPGVISN